MAFVQFSRKIFSTALSKITRWVATSLRNPAFHCFFGTPLCICMLHDAISIEKACSIRYIRESLLVVSFLQDPHELKCCQRVPINSINQSYLKPSSFSSSLALPAAAPGSMAVAETGLTAGGGWATIFNRTNVRNNFPRAKETKRIRTHGWEKRLQSEGGRRIIMRRILKGRHVLSH